VTRDACYRIGRSTAGLGLFATMPIERGAFIVEYSGPRIPTREAHAREKTSGARYMFEINSRWTVDGSARSNIGRYANHSCRPNAESVLKKSKVILRAIRAVEVGEEITYDYGEEYFELFIQTERLSLRKMRGGRQGAQSKKARRLSYGLSRSTSCR